MKSRFAVLLVLALASVSSLRAQSPGRFASQFSRPHQARHRLTTFVKPSLPAPLAHTGASRGIKALPDPSGHRATPFARTQANLRKGPALQTVGFVSASEIPAGGVPYTTIFQADVNGDGKKDLVSAISDNGYCISVALGNGDGTFQPPNLTALPDSDPLLVGDLNGDGKADVVQIHGEGPSTFDVWISDTNGDGKFSHTMGATFNISTAGLQGGVLTDLNGDGKLDLLTIDTANPGLVWTSLGNGDGTFLNATSTALAGFAPDTLTFGDFNGDGKVDFAGLNYTTEQVDVYLQTSTGFVQSGTSLLTPDAAYDTVRLASGDITGDGRDEIVSANGQDQTITVYVNNGDGTFHTGVYYPSAAASGDTAANILPNAASIADVNHDGKGDVVVTNNNGSDLTILLGHADGTLTVPTLGNAVGGYPTYPAVIADFDGDGIADLVVGDFEYSYVYMKGYDDGTFHAALDYYSTGGNVGIEIATADFNGDGVPDFVMTDCCGSSTASVFLGRPDGSLQPGVSYGSAGLSIGVVVGDFNGDHKPDFAATDASGDGTIDVFLGNGDGTFTAGSQFPAFFSLSFPAGMVSGDFNHDGFLDLAVVIADPQAVDVLFGDGAGNFSPPTSYPLSQGALSLATADLNGDGYLDLVVPLLQHPGNGVAILLGNTDNSGTFASQPDQLLGSANPYSAAIGDFNGDGKPDLAVTIDDFALNLNGVAIALGNGDGTFGAATLFPTSLQNPNLDRPQPSYIKVFDLNADGQADLIVSNSRYGTVATLFGDGTGSFSSPIEYASGGYAYGLALADVNGDGAIDAVTAGDDFLGATVLLNSSGAATQPDFVVATDSSSATTTAGSSAAYNLTLHGLRGYHGTVTFTCSGLPAEATCSFSPASITANSSDVFATALTIATTKGRTVSSLQPLPRQAPASGPTWAYLGGLGSLALFGTLFTVGGKRHRRRSTIMLGLLLLAMITFFTACGDDRVIPGSPKGTYTVMVTASGTGIHLPTHTVSLTLTVQ